LDSAVTEDVCERRQGARRGRFEEHGILAARVRPGHRAAIVDVSAGGALIETACRLLPGSAVELHMETPTGHTTIRGRVLRCAVSGVRPASIRYRGAIGFDRQMPRLSGADPEGYAVPGSGTRPGHGFRAETTPEVL
jgi:hypothetical protein